MRYKGKVHNGVVVLDRNEPLADGTIVTVEPLEEGDRSGSRGLMKLAGAAVGLPSDASRNHDHYLYGTAKK